MRGYLPRNTSKLRAAWQVLKGMRWGHTGRVAVGRRDGEIHPRPRLRGRDLKLQRSCGKEWKHARVLPGALLLWVPRWNIQYVRTGHGKTAVWLFSNNI